MATNTALMCSIERIEAMNNNKNDKSARIRALSTRVSDEARCIVPSGIGPAKD